MTIVYKPCLPLLLVSSMLAGMSGAVALRAEEEPELLEEIVVRGIKRAQASAVDTKRNALSIVDVISAEDIGKLPDVTISDSLQRITGVQIRRSAGEGSAINIRGLPQVLTMLNGESYLGAGSVTTVQPDFGDIPSSLFAGADVIKSPLAGLTSGGITGTVNLKTRRPFDLEAGWTLAGAAELGYGEDSRETDPSVNGLASWKGERLGLLLSASYREANLANYYNGLAGNSGWTGMPDESWAWGDAPTDINGDGDTDDAFIAYVGHTAYNKFSERERLGINGSLQFDLGEGFMLTADFFYTDMDEFDRRAGVANSDKWQSWGWFAPQAYRQAAGNIHSVQVYAGAGRRLKSYSEVVVTESQSRNINLELNYDNGGPVRLGIRALSGEAEQNRINSYMDIDLADGSQWGVAVQNYPGGPRATNPGGYSGIPRITVDYSGEHPHWSGFEDYASDLDSYGVGALSSENNYDREGLLDVFRADLSYDFSADSWITSIDTGLRYSAREAFNLQYHLMAPMGEQGCLVRWKATDVVMGDETCSYGDSQGAYASGLPIPLSSFGGDVIRVTDYGPVTGIPAFYALDPAAMDKVRAFHNALYPGHIKAAIPGQSYGVDLDEQHFYLQGNFSGELGVPYSGNLGVRVVRTSLGIRQNLVGASQPYGAPEGDDGDRVTEREYTDVLPALNLAFELGTDLILRAAYAKTMTPLDLEQWGGGLTPFYNINAETGIFEINGANALGNPELDPWRADNYDLSLEYYTGPASMMSAGLFRIEVESFVEAGSVLMDLPDQDGVVRRTTAVNTNVQGDGGTLEGVELQLKQAFAFLPGIWSDFGVDVNYTWSPSDSGNRDLNGDKLPFIDNSEHLFNLIGWYQSEKLQARIAYNYRSERVVAFNQVWNTEGLTLFQDESAYVDVALSYDISEALTVYLNGSNITGEYEEYYLQWKDQKAYQNIYEPRWSLGVRGRF